MKAGFRIEAATVKNGAFTYPTFRLLGRSCDGQRVRRQFKSRDEAEGERNRLEVEAANDESGTRPINTRLTVEQVAEAESAFTRLAHRSLSEAVEWFIATYRPPQTEMALETATAAFLADRRAHVRAVVVNDYRRTFVALNAAFPKKKVHEISTEDIQTFLAARNVGKKRFNNLRGELHTLFVFCSLAPRKWIRENPVSPIPAFRLSRGLPQIMTAQKAAELMAFVESYDGGPRRNLARGCMVPYVALCLFAGLRPSSLNGEIMKLASRPDLEKLVDLELGVIRVSPEISKVKAVRQITIQPNLAAWLARYPLNKFPILPLGARKMIKEIRDRFGIGQDEARHTFISMHVAKFKSMGTAALEAGNSERMIRVHYYNVVTDAAANAFWAIAPAAWSVTPANKPELKLHLAHDTQP